METKNFKGLISENQIIIPIIQRDYAQGRDDEMVKTIRNEFLTALHNAVKGEGIKLDFVYGVIDSGVFTPLDGQQRLTTLFLLHWYAKNVLRQESYAELNLSRFTYKTHPAARQFCEKLVGLESLTKNTLDEEYLKYEKENNDKKKQPTLISDHIENKVTWWIAEWKDDPTIAGMLTMLDAIYMEFRNEPSISLDNIEFYLYNLNDKKDTYNELTEDIYIKMNARGLALTPFEKLKGHILEEIGKKEGINTKLDIALKFDSTWTDCMWDQAKDQPDPGKVIDGYFIRYIRFMCDTFLGKRKHTNDFEMVDNTIAKESVIIGNKSVSFYDYLIGAFDCLKKHVDDNDNYLTSKETPDPIQNLKVGKDSDTLFLRCLKGYTLPSDSERTHREFTIAQTLLLYAFLAGHIADIDTNSPEFHERLRRVRNLIWNSDLDDKNLPELLDDTKAIICSEKLPDMVKAFSQEQLEEEKKKANQCIEWRNANDLDKISALYQLEDHDCLHGKIGLFGDLTDLGVQYKDAFLALYSSMDENRIIQIGCALVHDNAYPKEPYIFRLTNAWRNMYHKVEGFYKYHQSVLKLLGTLREKESVSDQLKEIIDEKIKKHIENKRFDWRYYFVKYQDIHLGSYCALGEYKKPGYNLTVMFKSNYKGRHRDAYLLAMHLAMKDNKNNYPLNEYGGPLTVKGYKIYNEESRLRVVDGDGGEWERKIDQVDKIDNEDRVEVGIDLITRLSEEKDPESIGLERIPARLAEFAEGEVVDGGAEGGEE